MKKSNYIVIVLVASLAFMAGCHEYAIQGEFEAISSFVPDQRADSPKSPDRLVASYDDYCDKIVLSWMPSVRTSTYDLYKNGELLAGDLVDTFYTDLEALPVDSEYWIIAKNVNGESDSAYAIGRMADVPPDVINFSATDGEYETKVVLTWDPADYAKYYEISRGGVLIADSVVGTAYSDTQAPQELTEYSIRAISLCGQSGLVTASGRADTLLKYSIIIDENFDGLETGFDLTTLDMFFTRFNFTTGGPGTFTVSEVDAVSGTKCAQAILNEDKIETLTSQRSIQIVFDDVYLLVGQRYRISYKIKTPATTSLHIAIDTDGNTFPSKTDGVDAYLIPTAVNPNNGNLYGINVSPSPEWKTVSYEFPYSGTGVADNDPDPETLGWVPTTIQVGQEHPKIMIAQWVGKGTFDGICPAVLLDDIKIELIK